MISLSLRTKVLNEYLCYSRVLEFIIETLKFIENVVGNWMERRVVRYSVYKDYNKVYGVNEYYKKST